MIDIYNMVFTKLYDRLHSEYPDANISDRYDEQTAVFPCITIMEIDNVPLRRTATDNNSENHSTIRYEIAVYSDKMKTARSEIRKILGTVDEVMRNDMKFRRIRVNQPINIARTIFRQYARYEVIVAEPKVIGEDTVYQMYRR